MSKYIYKNKLKECPNCGASLSEDDKECPNCSVNLVGLNEEQNRATNLNHSANEMENILTQKTKVDQTISVEEQKRKKAKIILFVIIGVIIASFFLVPLIGNNLENIEKASKAGQWKTYEQIANDFKNADNLETITIKVSNNEKGELKNNKSNENCFSEVYFNKNNNKTSIDFGYQQNGIKKTFSYGYDDDIVFVPEIDVSANEIVYTAKKGVNIYQTFKSMENYKDIDEYVLDTYIREDKNIAKKYGYIELLSEKSSLEIENKVPLRFSVYVIERAGNASGSKLVIATELNDGLVYTKTFLAYKIDDIYEISENIEKYFQLEYSEKSISD